MRESDADRVELAILVVIAMGFAWICVRRMSVGIQGRRIRRPSLLAIGQRLGGVLVGSEVRATVAGVPVVMSWASESTLPLRTWVTAAARFAEGALTLRPQVPADASLIERGLAVDLQLGDPVFDDAFLVEGAPADIVRKLLDADVRAALLRAGTIVATAGPHGVTVERPGLVYNADEAEALARACAQLAARIPGAVEDADDARARAGAAYREEPTREGERARAQERAAEIAAVLATQALRGRRAERIGWIVLAVTAAALAAATAYGITHPRRYW